MYPVWNLQGTPASSGVRITADGDYNVNHEQISTKLNGIIAESLGVSADEIQVSSSFIEDLGADSLDIVELVMAIEKEFSIEIPDEDAEKIATVQDAVSYVGNHLA